MQHHRRGLTPRNMIPIKHRPALLLRRFPLAGNAVDHALHVRVIGRSIGDNLEIENSSSAK